MSSQSHFPQQQPQLNPGWMNQMQQFSTGMAAMGFNPVFQQQLFQDALAMSQPVEAADEPLLVQVLLSAKKKKESYKDALNGLHGKNGHSASLWKDYYLDHKDHIDTWINMCLEKEKSQSVDKHTVKPYDRRPQLHAIKRESSPGRIPASAPPAMKRRKHSTPSTSATPGPAMSGRSTLNSLSVPSPVFNDRLPPPHSEIKIPDPPSRSPSPPTKVIPQGRGNKYTDEDRQFFLKFISWRLKQDPSLTRNDLCSMLAEKAPHHTAQSWASHWSNRHDLPDKILAAAHGESLTDEDDDDDDEPEQVRPAKRQPHYRDLSSDEEEEEEGGGNKSEGEEEEEEEDDNDSVKRYTENEMGQKGEPFTDADLYMAAKHAAKYSAWGEMASKDRWERFAEKFQQRSAKSWAEYYRRNEDSILKLRKRIRKEMDNEVLPERCARPSRPLGKRRYTKSDSSESEAEADDGQKRNTADSEDT
ncbi:hypothetical protein P691DRAFT_655007 [Macrolepiota fuliginosa MF-IS2]|uniref:Uncharacterized protein n=1 Tax=Macrolepiota fuliginosa MF-IS2 TaxID=1400762 RepID=A0A9P5XSU0_9AGAR|nr:hypothetical protein P691DRAFT_655007 [Macrolepiota fuliginosa MF-IS2]